MQKWGNYRVSMLDDVIIALFALARPIQRKSNASVLIAAESGI